MAFRGFKNLNRRTAANKVLRDKAFHIAKCPKYDEYQYVLASMVYICFDTKTSGSGIKNTSNKELAEESHKPIIRKCDIKKAQSPIIDNIWGTDSSYATDK